MTFPQRFFNIPSFSNQNNNLPPFPSSMQMNSRSISDLVFQPPQFDMASILSNSSVFLQVNPQMFHPLNFSAPVHPSIVDSFLLPHIQKNFPLQTLAEYATFERQTLPNSMLPFQISEQSRHEVSNFATPKPFQFDDNQSDSDSEDQPSSDQIKNIYNLPPEIDNQDTNFNEFKPKSHSDSVQIFQDKTMTSKVRNGQTLNKDLLLFFITGPVKILESFGISPSTMMNNGDILIEKSIFTKGNSKTIPPDPSEGSCVLHAKVVDETNNTMQLCKTCSKKTTNNMFLARKIEVLKDFRLKIIGSIACSGHPTSVNRDLRVIFTIMRKGNIIWEGSSIVFKIFHHRMKLGNKRPRSESSEMESPDVPKKRHMKQGRPSLNDTLSAPNEDLLLSEVKEILPKMREWGIRDSSNFMTQHFHDSVHICNAFLKLQKSQKLNLNSSCKFLPFFFEYVHHFSAYRDYQWSVVNGSDGEASSHAEYHRSKMDNIDAYFRSMLSPELLSWREVLESFWKLFQYPSRELKNLFCSCEMCLHNHLAFMASFAKNEKRMSFRKIAERLNTLKISTPQDKKWHSSLNGLLAKRGVFNYSLYLSDEAIGQFSRECLRTEEFAKFHTKFLHECSVVSAPKCDATELVESFNKLIFSEM